MVYKIKSETEEEDIEPSFLQNSLETTKRLPKIIGAGAGAATAGAFSSPAQLADLGARGVLGLAGQKSTPYEETPVSKLLPTTEQHLQSIHNKFPSTKPRNEVEKFSQDLVKDALSLYTPGAILKFGKYALTPLRSLAISLAGNTAGLGVEKFTGDEKKGSLVKNGLMLGLNLFNPTSANAIKTDLYKGADALLPTSATSSSTRMMNRLSQLENKVLQGRPKTNVAPSEKFVLDQIDKFKNLDNQGNINIRSLVAQKRSASEELAKAVYELPDRALKARARNLATELTHISKDTLKQYGTQNPSWWKLQQDADLAASAIYKSNFVSKALEKVMKGRPEALAHLFGIGAPVAASFVSAPGAGLGVGGYLAAKYGTRIAKSPALRNHYAKVVGTALAGNVPEKKLNEEVDKFEKELNKNSKSKFKIKSK